MGHKRKTNQRSLQHQWPGKAVALQKRMIGEHNLNLKGQAGGRSATISLPNRHGRILDFAIALEACLLEPQTFGLLRARIAHAVARWWIPWYEPGSIKPKSEPLRRVENPRPGTEKGPLGGCMDVGTLCHGVDTTMLYTHFMSDILSINFAG